MTTSDSEGHLPIGDSNASSCLHAWLARLAFNFINTFAEESNPDSILHDGRVVASGIIHKRKPSAAMHAETKNAAFTKSPFTLVWCARPSPLPGPYTTEGDREGLAC